jgi:triphosphatase
VAVERELKYTAPDAAALEPLRQAPDLAGVPLSAPTAGTYVDTYLDTPGRALRRAGYACRLRNKNGQWLVTLKGLSAALPAGAWSQGALHERDELEAPSSGLPDPDGWPDGPARDQVLALAAGAPLCELFTLRQARVMRRFGPAGTPVAELSLDEVLVERDGTAVETFYEVEVEDWRSGETPDLGEAPDFLERIGEALETLGLAAQPLSKYERGLALTRVKAPGVRGDDALAEAARKVIGVQAARLFEHEAGARAGDADAVHDMRVATRRMRAALELFGTAFKRKTVRALGDGLRATARALGAVRDLDVLIAHAQATAGLAPLLEEWETQRAAARAALAERLAGAEHAAFAERLGTFANTAGAGAARGADAPAQQLRYVAGELVWRRYQAVRAYEPVVRWAPLETLHALRIDAKYLRYTLEFLREVLGPETPGLIATLVALQDHLGALHDADVTAGLLRDYLAQHPDPERFVTGYLLAHERELRRLQRGARRAWAHTASAAYRRRLARAIAAL